MIITINYPERLVEQGSEEWHAVRRGHVSASNISAVMAKGKGITRRNYMMRIIAERNSSWQGDAYTNPAMEHGVNTEYLARQAYEVSRGTFVDKTGFWKHPEIEWVGASPDGLVGDDGLIEIKCPNTTTHLEYIFDDVVPTEYYKQMQCQLWVTGRQWCDFISYDPRVFLEKKKLFVKRCTRDENLIAEMEVEVLAFLGEIAVMTNILSGEK